MYTFSLSSPPSFIPFFFLFFFFFFFFFFFPLFLSLSIFAIVGQGNDDTEEKFLKESGLSRHHTYAIRRRMNTLRTTMKIKRGKWSRESRVGAGVMNNNGFTSKDGEPKVQCRDRRRTYGWLGGGEYIGRGGGGGGAGHKSG